MRELYVRLQWPDYFECLDMEGFEENSVFDPNSNSFFVKRDWYRLNTDKI